MTLCFIDVWRLHYAGRADFSVFTCPIVTSLVRLNILPRLNQLVQIQRIIQRMDHAELETQISERNCSLFDDLV